MTSGALCRSRTLSRGLREGARNGPHRSLWTPQQHPRVHSTQPHTPLAQRPAPPLSLVHRNIGSLGHLFFYLCPLPPACPKPAMTPAGHICASLLAGAGPWWEGLCCQAHRPTGRQGVLQQRSTPIPAPCRQLSWPASSAMTFFLRPSDPPYDYSLPHRDSVGLGPSLLL